MKKVILAIVALACSLVGNAQSIERKGEFNGGKVIATSAEKLFSGCQMRMVRYTKDSKVFFGIELDLTDRADHVCEGNLFTIHFKDGTRITLSNLFDTKADVKHDDHVQTYDHTYTDYVPVYDAWNDVVFAAPVTGHYQEHVPVHSRTSKASLFYIISPKQIEKIIKGDIKEVSIVTDDDTIVKKARPLSEATAELYELIK